MIKKQIDRIAQQKPIRIALQIGEQIKNSAVSVYSGQTAFFLMLSFFPFMLFLFALLRLTPLTEKNLEHFVLTVFPTVFQSFISKLIHNIYSEGSVPVLSITIISAVWLGSKSFLCLAGGLNSMYQEKESRNFFVLRFFSCIYSILFAVLLMLSLALLVFGNWLHLHIISRFAVIDAFLGQILHFRSLIGFFIFFVFFVFLYKILPNCNLKLRFHIPGALLASIGWILFSYLYSFYVDHFNNYASFYGTMTTIALLMVWLYACMYILFLGGILNYRLYTLKTGER